MVFRVHLAVKNPNIIIKRTLSTYFKASRKNREKSKVLPNIHSPPPSDQGLNKRLFSPEFRRSGTKDLRYVLI